MPPALRGRLDTLTSLRFFAATAVLVGHINGDVLKVGALAPLNSAGGVGVGFFFVLSGFVLTWSHREGDRAMPFYRRRFARIYPLHFATYLLAFPVLVLAGTRTSSASVNLPAAIASPLLIQTWFPDVRVFYGMNAPSWSLSNEAFFYLLFPLLIPVVLKLSQRAATAAVVGGAAVYLLGALSLTAMIGPPAYDGLYLLPAWRVIEFVIGCLLAHAVRHGLRLRVPVWLALGLVAGVFLGVGYVLRRLLDFNTPGVLDALLLPFLVVLITAAATRDVEGRRGVLQTRWLVRLGEWSFAVYLTHWLFLDVALAVLPPLDGASLPFKAAAEVLLAVIAVVIGAAAYYVIERPAERRLRGTRSRPELVTATGKAG